LERLVPLGAAVARDLGAPAEAALADLAEDPAQVRAVRAGAFLEDAVRIRAAEEIGAIAGRGIDPRHAPGVDLRVVEAKRRAVLVRERPPGLRLADMRPAPCRRDPDVLQRASFEYPGEIDLPVVAATRAVGKECLALGLPRADELAVKLGPLGELGRRRV